jgi:hypothetical protein
MRSRCEDLAADVRAICASGRGELRCSVPRREGGGRRCRRSRNAGGGGDARRGGTAEAPQRRRRQRRRRTRELRAHRRRRGRARGGGARAPCVRRFAKAGRRSLLNNVSGSGPVQWYRCFFLVTSTAFWTLPIGNGFVR